MTLTEAYRYQNFLSEIFRQVRMHLSSTGYITKIEEIHNRKKVYADAEDERINIEKNFDIDCEVNTMVDFAMDLIAEREKVSTAIGEAKKKVETDIDRDIAINKMRHELAPVLANMSNIRNGQTTSNGTGYKFNNDGVQVPYCYSVDKITTIDFDRNMVKGLSKKLSREADEISSKLDLINVSTKIDFAPKYDVNDTLEDCILVFCSN